MEGSSLPASQKRRFDEATSDRDDLKRLRRYDDAEDSSPGIVNYHEILDKLPPITSRVQRYCGVDRPLRYITTATIPYSRYLPHNAPYLPLAADEIRLFKVCAGTKKDPLRGALVHAPLSAVEDRYEALSYVWGSSAPSETVTVTHCNGKTNTPETKVSIQPSLYTALRQLRRQDQEIVIWADALCIDQQNVKERSEQVRRMANIYRCAANVIVWLGESSMQSRAAMRTISSMLTPGFFSKITSYDWSVVYALLQNEWFSRRWVVQEIVSAKNATLIIGDDKLDWRDFADAVELFETNIDDISQQLRRTLRHKYDTLGSLNHSGALELMRATKQLKPLSMDQSEKPRRNLEWLLTSLKAFQTADPRDTIYALLAIAADGSSIMPDYEKTLLEVLMDVMFHVIDQSSSLDILLRHWFPVSRESTGMNYDSLSTYMSKDCNWLTNLASSIGINTASSSTLRDHRLNSLNAGAKITLSRKQVFTIPLISKESVNSNNPQAGPESSINYAMSTQAPHRLFDDTTFPVYDRMPLWIRNVDGLPFGDPRARSTRRINGNALIGLPGEGHYNATKGKVAQVRFGKGSTTPTLMFLWDAPHREERHDPKSATTKTHDKYNGVLYAQGVELGVVTDLSARMADGLALQECLEMGGFPLRQATAGQDVPDKLWRTLVAGRDSKGQPATTLYRLAFVNLASQISEHRSIDPGELLTTKLDSYIRNFVERMEEVVWNRRIFKAKPWNRPDSATSQNDELFGLAPQQARINDKVCLLFGCSVPVILREQKVFAGTICDIVSKRSQTFYEIVGEAYVDGFMDGQAFQGEYGQEIEGQTREFALQ